MFLPEHIARCIEKLEKAGFAAYAVGGCVRDDCLGRSPQDFDLCTSALPEQTETVFANYPQSTEGKKHGTIRVVISGETVEITTFRKEGAYTDSRHPDWVAFVENVEEDLARRDFTVNAMAWSPLRGYADPFGGRKDLQINLLRTVGEPVARFREDPLRILRGVRFACRYAMTVEVHTEKAMLELAPLLLQLSKERIFEELCRILPLATAADLIRFQKIFTTVIPELEPMVNFDQRSPHHAYDLYTHTALVTGAVCRELPVRWAALLHDIGKIPTFTQDETGRGHYYGHARKSAQMADRILRDFHAPSEVRDRAVMLIESHMVRLVPEKPKLRRSIAALGWDGIVQCLDLQQADMGSKGVDGRKSQHHFQQVRRALDQIRQDRECLSVKDLAVDGHDLLQLGFSGREVGRLLQALLEMVMDEKVPNEKQALLNCMAQL